MEPTECLAVAVGHGRGLDMCRRGVRCTLAMAGLFHTSFVAAVERSSARDTCIHT
jgi:hypothetical protein